MNLRFIEAFVWVARLSSFTAAAEKLNATQTAISARIATLEQDFGVKLFDRDKRTVTLTHAGADLLTYAEELLGLSARMFQAMSDRGSFEGFISVGVVETVVHTWLPELLGRLKQQFPKVRVEIHSYMTADLHEELMNGNIDLALAVEALEGPTIENDRICAFQMGWITAPRTAEALAVSGAELLKRLPILTFLPGSLVYRDVIAKLGPYSAARVNPISSIAAMVSLARIGYGVATLPIAAIRPALDSGELIALEGVPELSPLPVIATRRRQYESPLVPAVVLIAMDAARAFASRGRPDPRLVVGGQPI